jgi:ribosomal protein L11 methyltransferase
VNAEHSDVAWNLITIEISRGCEEDVSSALFDMGTTGIVTATETEASVTLEAYFADDQPEEDLVGLIASRLTAARLDSAVVSLKSSRIADQDWMQKWKEGFDAAEIGERLLIAPSWKRPDYATDRIVIQIDPGMAFGTGTHETTRLCLEAIERYWSGGALLDVGTGTGILAIASALLRPGARIVALDIDHVAVEVARENASLNGVRRDIEILEAHPLALSGATFDVVVANLTAEVILGTISELVRLTADRGVVILSGILTSLAAEVERAVGEAGLCLVDRRVAGEWAALVASKGDF